MRKGIFSLEDNQEVVTPGSEDVTAFVESPEAALEPVQDAEADISELTDSMEDAEEVADNIDEIADQVEETIPEGGLTEPTAAALDVAVEALKNSIGMPKRKGSFASETFGDKASRINATKLAVEDWKAQVASIWTAIVNGFKSAIEAVKKFFTSVFDWAEKAKFRAEKLEALAAEKKDKVAGADVKVVSDKITKFLSVAGKVPEGGSLASELSKNAKLVEQAQKLTQEVSAELSTYVVASLKLPKTAPDANFSKAGKVTAPDGYTAPVGTELTGTELVFGGAVAYLQTPVSEEGKPAGKVKAWVGKVAGYKEPEAQELSPLSPQDAASAASVVKTHMASYKAAKDVLKAIDKVEKDVVGKVEEASKTSDEAEAQGKIKAARAAASSLVNLVSNGLSSVRSYDIKVAGAALDYVAQSLKAAV